MKESKDVMIANLAGTDELTDIASPHNDFSSNFDIIRNLFPNGLPDASCTNLDLNLTTPNKVKLKGEKKGETLEAKEGNNLKTGVSETFKLSGLLKSPKRKDDWFYPIDDMTREFYKKSNRIPNELQAWKLLGSNPLDDYGITKRAGQDDCLFMNGSPLLSKKAFIKRWRKYTK